MSIFCTAQYGVTHGPEVYQLFHGFSTYGLPTHFGTYTYTASTS